MEDNLDSIAEGKNNWVKIIEDFYKPFKIDLSNAEKTMTNVKQVEIETKFICEKCKNKMVVKWGKLGYFLACSTYPDCKNTKEVEKTGENTFILKKLETTDENCKKCKSPMVIKHGRFGRFLACSKYPDCKSTAPISIGIKCPEDGGNVIERQTKTKRLFYGCSNFPKCKFATWNKPVIIKCPACGNSYMEERITKDGDKTIFCPKKECKHKLTSEEMPKTKEESTQKESK